MTLRMFAIDVETTGLDPEKDEVIELGAVEIDGPQLLDMCSSFVRPINSIPPEASAIHHITDEDVASAPALALVIEGMRPHWPSVDDIIAAHNCRFDMRFFPELKGARWVDTWRCSMHVWPDAPNWKLQTLRYWLKLPFRKGPTHRAADDATLAALLLLRLLEERSIEELQSLSTKCVLLKKVGFGKHRGTLWTEVPTDYLRWAAKQSFEPDDAYTVKRELERRFP